MIRLLQVGKSYPPGTTALSDITLHVEKGEFAFLTGPSGAGKTTLLRLLLREELATTGQVMVNGRDVAKLAPREVPYLRRTIGVVFQDFKLIQSRTVLENITFVLEAVGVPAAARKPRAMRVLTQVSLQHKIHSYPLQLSGGEQQRVAIARALVNDPLLLLADEPTGNLDADLSSDILNLLREINARGTTVLVATHDRDLIRRMARRVIQLQAGRLVSAGRVAGAAAIPGTISAAGGLSARPPDEVA
jgi:cell division transport system ATP-binding protein